jgi:hypothetical protein
LRDANNAFTDDLNEMGASKRVVGMTFSEFGRRVKSNAGNGTDHGAAAPLILFGDAIQHGVLGSNPIINKQATVSDNIPMQYDFRSVYASLLSQWFCVDENLLEKVMLKNFQSLPLIKPEMSCLAKDVTVNHQEIGKKIISNYPNPFVENTNIQYVSKGGHVLIQVFDNQGKLISTLIDAIKPAGNYSVRFENIFYKPGIYYARIQNEDLQQITTMVIAQ